MFSSFILLIISLSSFVLAAPLDFTSALVSETSRGRPGFGGLPVPLCPISRFKGTDLLTGLVVNAGEVPNYVFIGRGTQNYTCGSAGVYVSVGAVADFYDASCLISLPSASTTLASVALKAIPFPSKGPFTPAAKHFFRANADATINPVFKLSSNGNEFVGKKIAAVAAPKDPNVNVPWLQLGLVSGTLGKTFYRVDTAGGQPPATCSNVTDTGVKTVPYAAIYWSYK